jgi:hypothetical protein
MRTAEPVSYRDSLIACGFSLEPCNLHDEYKTPRAFPVEWLFRCVSTPWILVSYWKLTLVISLLPADTDVSLYPALEDIIMKGLYIVNSNSEGSLARRGEMDRWPFWAVAYSYLHEVSE